MNVALHKPAIHHPGTLRQYIATNAVDGKSINVNGPFSTTTCSHTSMNPEDEPDWWRVDLGESYRISGIKIYNRERVGKLFGICS